MTRRIRGRTVGMNSVLFPMLSPQRCAAVAILSLLAGAVCSPARGSDDRAFAGPSDLVATMPDPYNVHLQWKNHATADGGAMVEFQLYPKGASLPAEERGQFLILAFLDPKADTFRHENLGSETVLSYRIHPYFGNCTAPVAITTGSKAATEKEAEEPEGPLDDPEKNPKAGSGLKSIRTLRTLADAAPTNLSVSLSHATHAVIRWRDCAVDADGYLVEISQYADHDFQVCALLPPHTTSFRKIALRPETKLYFRVRAFFYGPPSNVVTKTTGLELAAAIGPKN
jgi:hypothetical protein